jgi:hypothetical protein
MIEIIILKLKTAKLDKTGSAKTKYKQDEKKEKIEKSRIKSNKNIKRNIVFRKAENSF